MPLRNGTDDLQEILDSQLGIAGHTIKKSNVPFQTSNFETQISSAPNTSDTQDGGSAAQSGKRIIPEIRPRSSIPSSLSAVEFARQCTLAAYSSRLNPFALHSGEYKLLRDHITLPQVTVYLNIRNAVLRLWTKNPLVCVTREEAAGCARESRFFKLADLAHQWLLRNGYINFGCVENPATFGQMPRPKSRKAKQPCIVIIGAGMSGLGCARQLESLISQLESSWLRKGERRPKIIVLEGRNRIGGRVYSHPLTQNSRVSLPSGLRSTAEMGAQIITGFDHGNPLNVIVRGQLGLHYHALRDNTILYDHDGSIVDKDRDILVEKLYNDILERASTYRQKTQPSYTVEGNKTMMQWGKDPTTESGDMLSSLEHDGATILVHEEKRPLNKNNAGNQASLGVEKLAGRAYTLSTGSNAKLPAAKIAENLGWPLRQSIEDNHSIDLDNYTRKQEFPTLGNTMDEAIRQYQGIIDLSPQDMRLLNWHHANLEYANAINVNQLSLGGWDQDIGNEFEGFHSEMVGGYQQVPRGLWRLPTSLDVRFNKNVKVIRYCANSRNEVTTSVECEDGDIFEADEIVVTASLGVLKSDGLRFEPPLPEWKQGAIERLGFGLLNKVILVYDTAFWEEHRDMFGLLNDATSQQSLSQSDYSSHRGRFYLFWNCIKTSGQPTLVALMAGNAAFDTEVTDDKTLIRDVTDRLSRMFPSKKVPWPSEAIVTRWRKDRFARGSYSYMGPRAQSGDYDAMAQPVGHLHFAGEATCGTHPATVHGAYLSGLRAAAGVIESMIGPIKVPNPLVPPKVKSEQLHSLSQDGKHPIDEPGMQAMRVVKQATDEHYEASIIGAILKELGERPIKPGRSGVNPFLLYTNANWSRCKSDCDEAQRKAKNNPQAKASIYEVRSTIGAWWRKASTEEKRPFYDQTQLAKEAMTKSIVDFNDRVATWDREAARIREEYIRDNPLPNGQCQAFLGKTAIEQGGRRNKKRTTSAAE
ncbi:hypothetical protein M501DRAFT_941902 [Patellaria atrata CBS 101060]|uniref:SWIRM domain-containing protein n=1 Tax=Patellaria atrata CBS 101060 TaxID=1346257 RepID=A0A9P4S5Q7_9PEZI|nr:hypothetical protein M501DRAFT_941902 [Patellaria atrata CBS 101060]